MTVPLCLHQRVYYNKDTDNFYCADCRQGLGQEFYRLHWKGADDYPKTAEEAVKGDPDLGPENRSQDDRKWPDFLKAVSRFPDVIKNVGDDNHREDWLFYWAVYNEGWYDGCVEGVKNGVSAALEALKEL